MRGYPLFFFPEQSFPMKYASGQFQLLPKHKVNGDNWLKYFYRLLLYAKKLLEAFLVENVEAKVVLFLPY